MLSRSTFSFLSGLQEKAHATYPEGGLLYTYVEAANQAHSRSPSLTEGSSATRQIEFNEIGRLILRSQGEYLSDLVPPSFSATAQLLIEHLRDDLCFDEIQCLVEDGGYSMTGTIRMVRRQDNRYFELELWWSVD